MARIRTIKPEAFVSESLAAVSLTAERTFVGLLTQADDQGRHRDHAAIIAGQLWVLRPEHTPSDVETDLAQLADAGLICRYTGPDDKRYLHVITWHRHQKINRASKSRLPDCPRHNGPSGTRQSVAAPAAAVDVTEPAPSPHGTLRDTSGEVHEPAPHSGAGDKHAGQEDFTERSVRESGVLPASAVTPHRPDLGPRIVDLGSTPSGAASAPAPDTVSAKQLLAEYVAACNHRPPDAFLKHLGGQVRKLLDEGIAPTHLRAALERHRVKGLSPSVLPSLVHEVMNAASPATPAAHRTWTNPTDVVAAYGDEL
ncbi:hypothetical protein OHT59_10245 [Streptomyces sp. NBC_00243]|uniref:hypothetical protein n=1 Tax=Streptomyces sp. NBC_00243 TaxID=2975688 RepID=UPI002DD9ED9A|nr:hypothetical protein [Streptomyces sp. NBC_00243]WRZ18845.1 hypothetical protein OHT59_10245 [Streptomyces sp. NBC_00243]